MIRNEYRRAFIMLRAAMQGYGGHVRLERRTLTGSMYFIVTAPQGVEELSAALAGQQGGEYFAAPVGALARDRRGQLALAWTFDPRDIRGRPLEAYSWVVVVATGGPCAVALTGNVEGSRPMNPVALSRAVCALFGERREDGDVAPAATPGEDLPVLDDSAFISRQTRYEAAPPASPGDSASPGGDAQNDIKIYTGSRSRHRRGEAPASEGGAAPAATVPEDTGERGTEGAAPVTDVPEGTGEREAEGAAPVTDVPEGTGEREAEGAAPVTAARLLGLDITSPWPCEAESLRRLFATQAPLDAPLGEGFVYVSSPMPGGSGLGAGLAGLRAEDGRITAIRYALPGRRSPEPPAGLERYQWIPAVGEDGYWVITSDLSRTTSEGLGTRD